MLIFPLDFSNFFLIKMKYFTFILVVLLNMPPALKAQSTYQIPEHVKRIVFLGNSITYSGQYISYIETYFLIKYPNRKIEFINVGLPSETVSKLSEADHAKGKFPRPKLQERLKRILEQTKPDLIFACYGINDGIYLPFNESRFKKYKKGIHWLNKQITKQSVPIIYITPSVYDKQGGEAYSNVMNLYANWLLSKSYTDNWRVINTHWPMTKYLEEKRETDFNFMLTKDGIHPNNTGHWLIAKQILIYLEAINNNKIEDGNNMIYSLNNGTPILKLIEQKQAIMKDAWLTSTGHKRPEMKIGLPLNEAKQKELEIESEIKVLLKS